MSGRGTAGGVVFQSEVGACAAGLLLSERPLMRLSASLIGTPKAIKFETPEDVDDLLIETDLGSTYVQAKRTISLSAEPEGELASVADQFVRQFRNGVDECGVRRDFSPLRDRLVLAVSPDTTGPVRDNLRAVLDRVRTGAATGLPKALQVALNTFTALLTTAWFAQSQTPITENEKAELLRVCTVVEIGHSQRQLVEDTLRDVIPAGEASALFDLLVAWAASASQNGVGGDQAAIRQALIGKISLRMAPSLQDDIARLAESTRRVLTRLRRFTALPSAEGEVSFDRPVTQVVVDAVRNGSLALTGEPGAGKSAVIHAVAMALCSDTTVVVLTVEASSISLESIRQEMGLKRPIIELLSQISTTKPCYLLIDALDAVRGGAAEATYKRLVEEINQLDGWFIIASIRTFDLRLGREWRRLFAGTAPNSDYSDGSFPAVRHVHVGLLDAIEQQDIATQSPSLASAIGSGGDKLGHLARNPFNLALLGDLLRGGVDATTLSSVATRGQLLERYWEERVGDLGLIATTTLTSLVSMMLSARSLDLPETFVPVNCAATIDELQRAGVLVTEATRRVAFRHHILFDFAIAKLILLPDLSSAAQHFDRTRGSGLILVASLGYWFEKLKIEHPVREFWCFIVSIVGSDSIDPIIRVDVARLAVEGVGDKDAEHLANAILEVDPANNNAFHHFAGAFVSNLQSQRSANASLWIKILKILGVPTAKNLGSARSVIYSTMETNAVSVMDPSLGAVARDLFDAMLAEPGRSAWLGPVAISAVAKTWGTDPTASRTRLNSILEETRFAKFAYIEVPWLARESLTIAANDPDFIVELFYRAFRGGNFSRDQVTSMNNSWIMGLTSNALQDFRSALYSLSRDFPELLAQYPETALRALAAALRGKQESEHPIETPATPVTISLSNSSYEFIEDRSCIWAWEIDENDREDLAKMYQSAVDWALTAGASQLASAIPSLILHEANIAIAWRLLLRMGTINPSRIGRHLIHAATSPSLLMSLDTQRDAITLVATSYPFISVEERHVLETQALEICYSTFPDPDGARKELLGRLFEAIGTTALVSDDARLFLDQIKSDGRSFENVRPYEFRVTSGPAQHWLQREGVDVNAPKNSALLVCVETVRQSSKIIESSANALTLETSTLWQEIVALKRAFENSLPVDAALETDVSDALAEGLGVALLRNLVPEQHQAQCLSELLHFSHHEIPLPPSEEADKQFSDFPSWGTPSPRIEAAQRIAALACESKFWPLVNERFEQLLLSDPHPAVRFQLVRALPWIYRIDADAMWNLTEKIVASEQNGAVIKDLIATLSYVPSHDYPRVESLVLPLTSKSLPERGDDPLVGLIVLFAVCYGMPESRSLIDRWIADYAQQEKRLHSVLFDLRQNMLAGLGDNDETQSKIFHRTLDIIWLLVNAIEPAVRSLPVSNEPPTHKETVALKLFGEIADQIFFAVGHDTLALELVELSAQKKFLKHYSPLVSKLMTLGTPRAVHHLLSVINHVVAADPGQCFDLFSEAMLRTTGVSRYEHESMGAELFVQLIGMYLADYRELFDDSVRRAKLIDCIALFVEAGWPEARKLFQNLPDLLQ